MSLLCLMWWFPFPVKREHFDGQIEKNQTDASTDASKSIDKGNRRICFSYSPGEVEKSPEKRLHMRFGPDNQPIFSQTQGDPFVFYDVTRGLKYEPKEYRMPVCNSPRCIQCVSIPEFLPIYMNTYYQREYITNADHTHVHVPQVTSSLQGVLIS